jgi:capsular polysaccharide export protein
MALINNGNSPAMKRLDERSPVRPSSVRSALAPRENFLRMPPFPGARVRQFAQLDTSAATDVGAAAEKIRRLRVGGSYWGRQPTLPAGHTLVRSRGAMAAAERITPANPLVLWNPAVGVSPSADPSLVTGVCDPWHMLLGAAALITGTDDELRTIAALLEIPRHLFDPATGELVRDAVDAETLLRPALPQQALENPFTGEPMEVLDAIELCGFWRRLIDSNRDICGGLGFAFWKHAHVAPLLWGGSEPFQFLPGARDLRTGAPVAIWRAKTSAETIEQLEAQQTPVIEVEDGFLRSRGLGADCVPPLSITVDRLGCYFDPSGPSQLEEMLQNGEFDQALLERAGELRRLLVDSGLGKYERGLSVIERPAGARRHLLVIGQVEDDRAVIAGGCGLVRNIDLLARVRERAPDAYILYKPHPDVIAGHRRGAVTEDECLRFADAVVGDLPIASLIAMVDEVHVNTSLAGFEALLREKPVTTYGVPFYAGWGLTTDLGPVPARRSRKRSVDELAAAALLLYPRYFDPVTGLPCPAEVVVDRLSGGKDRNPGLIVGLRRLQGKLMGRLRSLVQ